MTHLSLLLLSCESFSINRIQGPQIDTAQKSKNTSKVHLCSVTDLVLVLTDCSKRTLFTGCHLLDLGELTQFLGALDDHLLVFVRWELSHGLMLLTSLRFLLGCFIGSVDISRHWTWTLSKLLEFTLRKPVQDKWVSWVVFG